MDRQKMNNSIVLFTMALLMAFSFVAISSNTAHAAATESEKTFEKQTTNLASQNPITDIIKDWRILSVTAIVTTIVIIAIAYMVGTGFELADMKAWASSEMVQVVVNTLIVVILLASIGFLDTIAQETVKQSGIAVDCTKGGQSCLGNVAIKYIDSYLEVAKSDAKNVVVKSIDSADKANTRYGIYCTSIICGQVGSSISKSGHLILEQDRYSTVFEYYTNLLSSLEAQKFFIKNISFNIGPILLAIGIVGRSFFLTRKAGGLLISTAVGIMFFLPGMYIFDWVTLDTTLTGDKNPDSSADLLCPSECKITPPIAIISEGKQITRFASAKEVNVAFPEETTKAKGIIDGTIGTASPSSGQYAGKTVSTCMKVGSTACPLYCRELPYPFSISKCAEFSVQQACSNLVDQCWVRRIAPDTPMNTKVLTSCPVECKIVPPLNSNCNKQNCLSSRPECRVFERVGYTGDSQNEFNWTLKPQKGTSTLNAQAIACEYGKDCKPDNNAYVSCSYVLPQTGSCTQLCSQCPEICRVITDNPKNLPSICLNQTKLNENPQQPVYELTTYCSNQCPIGCKVNATRIAEIAKSETNLPDAQCNSCPAERRIITYGQTLPANYTTGACEITTKCTADYRVAVPRNSCEQCIFSEQTEMYSPPIQTSCSDLCKPPDTAVTKNAVEFTKIGSEGLVGTPEIQNVAKLILPAYILPLINIVAALVFIRGLSAYIGGDVEIPGISKVF